MSTDIRPTPLTDAEWARNIVRRIEALEAPGTTRAGDWVLSDRDGQLTASRADGETLGLSAGAAQTEGLERRLTELAATVAALELQYAALAARVTTLEDA